MAFEEEIEYFSKKLEDAATSLEQKTSEDVQLESELEELLLNQIVKYLHEETEIIPQETLNTENGKFRPDFILKRGDLRVVLEANGKNYHDDFTDSLRGALILLHTDISSIFYLRGYDIHYDFHSVVFAVSEYVPEIFSERGLLNLQGATEVDQKRGEIKVDNFSMIQTGIREWDETRNEFEMIAYKMVFLVKGLKKGERLKEFERIALEAPGANIATIKEIYST